MIFRPLIQLPATSVIIAFFLLSFLVIGVFFSTHFHDFSSILQSSTHQKHSTLTNNTTKTPSNNTHRKTDIPLKCSDHNNNTTQTCPANYPSKPDPNPDTSPPPTCPEYFRWIHEDLQPWKKNGITRRMVDKAQKTANFRLVIHNGKAYIERYSEYWQKNRDVFTLWGILQLLRRYPGRVPDLELMFDCDDYPKIKKRPRRWPFDEAPSPLFRYCGDDGTRDVVFPDWSFWGWSDINIRPWEFLSKDLKEGNKKVKFTDREPYAYWKGNPLVAPHRMDLLKCNVSDKEDWNARLYVQDWEKEKQQGFKHSDLASQCLNRYKIYIEGSAWSVSEKYILACDSVSLVVKPLYYDFFSRSLMPLQHYWPVREDDKCRSIKFAVEWGNKHIEKAQSMGKTASDFILEDMKMDYVYDYMLHLLTEYAKHLKFKPRIPENAVELCSEIMVCSAVGLEKKFMMESLVKGPSDKAPCTMPPPYDRAALRALLRRETSALKLVEKWEKDYWINQTKHV
ncbi:hypothetical protein SOVF_180240 [Spinacia oleracea]|uniref:Glycosyl transferase CAP10 domain-containing protein n=1 Tax=Spinacia oleracea TaxID=3562 RepID=A0A9R0JPJ8_SPIOL|nr:uncharacterized protein LOC110782505 [Spinacia oleracea]KNA06528.1 hypothetical protein SOVF_180240 [Spinacia oleracea]